MTPAIAHAPHVPPPTYSYWATLLRVLDGDTVDLAIDVGFRMYAHMPIRLLGVAAPELHAPGGQAAQLYVIGWFTGQPVMVRTERNPEKYGRWLGVISDDTGRVLNEDLVRDHHALPWDGKGKQPTGP